MSNVAVVAAVLGLVVAAYSFVRALLSLVRTLSVADVASAPLAPRQPFEVPAAGSYEVWGEGRRLTRDFLGLRAELADAGGQPVALQRALIPTTSSGVSSARRKLWNFVAPSAGTYLLTVVNLPESPDPASRLVVTRAVTATLLAHVFVVVASGIVFAGCGLFLLVLASGGTVETR